MMREALETLSRFWGGIRWVCGWLDERSRALQPRAEAEASGSKATYQAAPAKVKADMMRFLARLRAAKRSAPLERVVQDAVSGSASAAKLASVPIAIGSPRSRLEGWGCPIPLSQSKAARQEKHAKVATRCVRLRRQPAWCSWARANSHLATGGTRLKHCWASRGWCSTASVTLRRPGTRWAIRAAC